MTDLVEVARSILMAPYERGVERQRCAYCRGTGLWFAPNPKGELGSWANNLDPQRCPHCVDGFIVVETPE